MKNHRCYRHGNIKKCLTNLELGESNKYKSIYKGENIMKPIAKEFQDDQELINEVNMQSEKGVSKDNLYVVSHDNDRTDRVAKQVNGNEIGIKEEGLKIAIGNLFHKKGDELRAKFQGIGFSAKEADELEEKLDHGKILLIITNN